MTFKIVGCRKEAHYCPQKTVMWSKLTNQVKNKILMSIKSLCEAAPSRTALLDTSNVPASPDSKLEFLWQAFNNINDWVRFSDTKAAAVLAADGIIVASIVTWLAGTHTEILKSAWVLGWLGLIVVAVFYSATYSLKSLAPNLFAGKHKRKASETGSSLIFFADIARNFSKPAEFQVKMQQTLADPNNAVAEICQQIWANSKVASSKYNCVSKAIFGIACAVYLGFIGIIVIAVIKLSKTP